MLGLDTVKGIFAGTHSSEQYAQLERAGQLPAMGAAQTVGLVRGKAMVRFELPQ